jgi:hypothetical protein
VPIETSDNLIFRDVWRKNDASVERDVIAAWKKEAALPPDVDPKERVKELCVVTCDKDQLAAISTCEIRLVPHVRQQMAVTRSFILPEYRQIGLVRRLTYSLHETMERYALANPNLRIGGTAGIAALNLTRDWPPLFADMSLIAFTKENEPIMLRWFDHFRIPVPQ